MAIQESIIDKATDQMAKSMAEVVGPALEAEYERGKRDGVPLTADKIASMLGSMINGRHTDKPAPEVPHGNGNGHNGNDAHFKGDTTTFSVLNAIGPGSSPTSIMELCRETGLTPWHVRKAVDTLLLGKRGRFIGKGTAKRVYRVG